VLPQVGRRFFAQCVSGTGLRCLSGLHCRQRRRRG
jgi:hypothetical protein